MEQPPNAFSNELEQWLYNEFSESVVFIDFRPRSPTRVKALWDCIDPLPREDAEAHLLRTTASQESQCSTGFIVKDDGVTISVLTCAHVLGPSFKAGRPITKSQIEALFAPYIICDHRENKFTYGNDVVRGYAIASVAAVSCPKDLLLLTIPRDQFLEHCEEPHRVIPIAAAYPKPLQGVGMLSWPPLRNRTAVTGKTSHRSRTMDSISIGNPRGYELNLAEVDIASDGGSSGAPLLNGAGEFVAVLHGGFGGSFTYFISLTDVRSTLSQWGVIDD